MGTYLSIPFTSRKVLQVEPSPKTAVKRDDLEVKDGEWVCGGKDPADVKPLTEEIIADLSRPLTPYEIGELNEKTNVPMSPILEVEEKKVEEEKEEDKKEEVKEEVKEEKKEEVKLKLWIDESPHEKELTDSMELIRNAMNAVVPVSPEVSRKEEVDKMEVIAEEPKIEAPRVPEFQPNANSASHAIKKFNRRHRKH
jgi:hypothetical protein